MQFSQKYSIYEHGFNSESSRKARLLYRKEQKAFETRLQHYDGRMEKKQEQIINHVMLKKGRRR